MKLTIDSTQPLEDVLRVLGALYDVELVIATDHTAMPSESGSGEAVKTSKKGSGTRSSTARVRGDKSRGTRGATGNSARSVRVAANAEIRAWAEQSGLRVSDRGRIPASVLDAYDQAHPN